MNIEQMTSPQDLHQRNASLEKEVSTLKDVVKVLEEQLNWFKRQIFGQRSEKIKELNSNSLTFGFYEEMEEEKAPEKPPALTRPSRKKSLQNDKIDFPDNLPKETVLLDIPEDQKVCRETGKPLIRIGEETTCKLAFKPGSYYIKEFIRPKYALPRNDGIVTAELPDSFLPKCRVDVSLVADILTKKFADHLPLYRISDVLARDGIHISRQILSTWVIKAGNALRPIYELMRKEILESGNIFVDETPLDLQEKGKGKTHQAFMWVISGGKSNDPPYRVYEFRYSRKHENAIQMLANYRGILHSDKYGAYETIAQEKQIIWCPCWAHIRRKFFEAEISDPKLKTWLLDKINALFMFEREAWEMPPEKRLEYRQEMEIPIIDELINVVKDTLLKGKLIPRSSFRKALGYFYSLIPHMKNYTYHPFARMDNNVAERAIRPLTIGRKNWLFVGSIEGGEAAAILFSLIQTCRALGVNPRDYLEDILQRVMGHSNQKLHELLPLNWAKKATI